MLRGMKQSGLALVVMFLSQISLAGVSFAPPQSVVDVGVSPTSVAVADLDGDGKDDLAVAAAFGGSGNQGSIAILFGNGDGTFHVFTRIDSGAGFPTAIALADVNKDGKPDLVVVNCEPAETFNSCPDETANGIVAVFLGNGNGTFQAPQTYDTGGSGGFAIVVASAFAIFAPSAILCFAVFRISERFRNKT